MGDVPAEVVTVTSTVPAPDGLKHWMVVLLISITPVAGLFGPKSTDRTLTKFVPPIVTSVPPDDGPPFGLTTVIVGRPAGASRSSSRSIPRRKRRRMGARVASRW